MFHQLIKARYFRARANPSIVLDASVDHCSQTWQTGRVALVASISEQMRVQTKLQTLPNEQPASIGGDAGHVECRVNHLVLLRNVDGESPRSDGHRVVVIDRRTFTDG
jgi:hypothetical protein